MSLTCKSKSRRLWPPKPWPLITSLIWKTARYLPHCLLHIHTGTHLHTCTYLHHTHMHAHTRQQADRSTDGLTELLAWLIFTGILEADSLTGTWVFVHLPVQGLLRSPEPPSKSSTPLLTTQVHRLAHSQLQVGTPGPGCPGAPRTGTGLDIGCIPSRRTFPSPSPPWDEA